LNVDTISGLLADATDIDGDPLTAVLVSGPSHGSLSLNSDGSFTYTPSSLYSGSDSFVYKLNDGAADSNLATVSLTITYVNRAPVASAEIYSTAEFLQLNVDTLSGLLADATDIDGDPLTAVLVSGPSHGSLSLSSDGTFTYTPSSLYSGSDSFVYKLNDG